MGPECFIPAPKVTSSVIRMRPLPSPPVPVKDEVRFFRVVKAAFGQRRKTLLNALSAGLPSLSREAVKAAVAACGLPDNVRGERLGIPEFAALTEALGEF